MRLTVMTRSYVCFALHDKVQETPNFTIQCIIADFAGAVLLTSRHYFPVSLCGPFVETID